MKASDCIEYVDVNIDIGWNKKIEKVPYGFNNIYAQRPTVRKGLIITGMGLVTILYTGAAYLAISIVSQVPRNVAAAAILPVAYGLVVCGGAYAGSKIFQDICKDLRERDIKRFEKKSPGFFEDEYRSTIDYFVSENQFPDMWGGFPDYTNHSLQDAVRFDSMPHFVQDFNPKRLENILLDLKCSNGLFGTAASDTNLHKGYLYLAQLLSKAEVPPEEVVPLFNLSPNEHCPYNYPQWVGGIWLCEYYIKNVITRKIL